MPSPQYVHRPGAVVRQGFAEVPLMTSVPSHVSLGSFRTPSPHCVQLLRHWFVLSFPSFTLLPSSQNSCPGLPTGGPFRMASPQYAHRPGAVVRHGFCAGLMTTSVPSHVSPKAASRTPSPHFVQLFRHWLVLSFPSSPLFPSSQISCPYR